jgi:bacterial/archaeal transporter family protein
MDWVYFCALLSAVFAGLVAILSKIGLEGVNSNLATTVRVLMLAPLLCALVAYQGTAGQVLKFTSKNWLFLFLSAVATGLSWLFYFFALSKRDAIWVAPIDKSSLAFTFILGVLILHEKVTWQNLTATVLVLAALAVTLVPSKPGQNSTMPAATPDLQSHNDASTQRR